MHSPVHAAVTLCADDYGLAPGIGRAIRALIDAGRLQATSCMTGSPFWPEEARLLKPLADRADIGLHVTLTDQRPLGPMPVLAPHGRLPSMPALIARTHARRIDRAEITLEIERQFEAFVREFGRAPDFIDGHQHVHVLPAVREAVLDLWRRRMGGAGWIRSCWEPPAAILRRRVSVPRALVISALARPMRARLAALGVKHNESFLGVYDYSGRVPFARVFEVFTHQPRPRTLVMCHPGEVDMHLLAVDPLTHQREAELKFLSSDAFVLSLAARRLTLARLT